MSTSPGVSEFVSDAFDSTAIDQEDLKKEMEQLVLNKKDNTSTPDGLLYTYTLSLSFPLSLSCIQIIRRNLSNCFFRPHIQTKRPSGRRSCSRSCRSTRWWQSRTTETNSGTKRSRKCCRLTRARLSQGEEDSETSWQMKGEPPSIRGSSQCFFVHNVRIREGEGLQQEWVTSAADGEFVQLR